MSEKSIIVRNNGESFLETACLQVDLLVAGRNKFTQAYKKYRIKDKEHILNFDLIKLAQKKN